MNRVKLIGELVKSFGITGTLLKYLMGFLSVRYARITAKDLVGDWIISDVGTSTGTWQASLCVIKSNWVILRPRVYAEIEVNPQIGECRGPAPLLRRRV